MSFATGSVSFSRFAVGGKQPKTIDQDLLDRLAAHVMREGEEGIPEEVEYGWVGGRHILDAQFNFEHNVFADALSFALRSDTNRVPGELKRAYTMMEEDVTAKGNPSGFISKQQKKQVKETIARKMDDELRSGKYRRSKMSPLLWDLPSKTLYASVGAKAQEQLLEIFERTFELTIEPISSGSLALSILEPEGKRRDYEDLRPTRFVHGPDGESQHPEYPWIAKGPQPKDFLGNEFLLWLWHAADARDGEIPTEAVGPVTVFIDKVLELDCTYGMTGKDSLRGDGPSRMPEAREAVRSGKIPRRAGLILDVQRQEFRANFNAETFAFTAAQLPEVTDADNQRMVFEERVTMLRDLCAGTDALFAAFLKVRCSSAWESQTSGIRKWIMQGGKAAVAA